MSVFKFPVITVEFSLCALRNLVINLLIVVEAHVLSYISHLYRKTVCEICLKNSYCFTKISSDLKLDLVYSSKLN